eukprot:scaffold4825_cov132-Cylindrotheca_fusiformis.AAC.9
MNGQQEAAAFIPSDVLARIQALENEEEEEESDDSDSFQNEIIVDELQEQLAVLEARIQKSQAKKLRDLELEIDETGAKLKKMGGRRFLDIDENDDDSFLDEVSTFPNNTFSFLLISRYPFCERKTAESEIDIDVSQTGKVSPDFLCLPFWLALAILVLQVTIYSLALQNTVDFKDHDNIFQFPINVDNYTRAAEGVDLFVQSFRYIQEVPGVKAWKYYIAAASQTTIGVYGIFVTFVIIMQSPSVVDLLLDFSAMEFVSALDDSAFLLSLRGFLGAPLKKTARNVKNARYTPRDKRIWLRKWPMFLVSLVLILCYVFVRIGQNNRIFGINEVYVELYDNAIPWLPTLSGTYIGCTISGSDQSDIDAGPIIYSELPVSTCTKNWRKEESAFFFCEGEHWVFAVGDDMQAPCTEWTLKSFKAGSTSVDAYDLLYHSAATWFAKDPNDLVEEGVLEKIGIFQLSQLAAPPEADCDILEARGLVFSFPFYSRLENVTVGNRPAFYGGDRTSGEYVLFDGRRWTVINESDLQLSCLPGCSAQADPLPCRADCLMSFDLFASNYTVRLISDPMDVKTTSDTWIPTTDLIWYVAKGSGRAASPKTRKASLAETIENIELLLLAVRGNSASPEQLAEAEALFAQSSSLDCRCRSSDEICIEQATCPQGSSLLIDLNTDAEGENTSFFLIEAGAYDRLVKEAENAVDLGEWHNTSNGLQAVDLLNDTGFFSWRNARGANFEKSSSYRYSTCMPHNTCAILSYEVTSGDGLSFPSRFDVFLNGEALPTDTYQSISQCLYRFGTACEPSVNCSNIIFEPSYDPDIDCPSGVLWAFEVDGGSDSFLMTDIDTWTESQGGQPIQLNATGQFEWQQSVTSGVPPSAEKKRYATCVPEDVCAVLFATRYPDGSFKLVYNGTFIGLDGTGYEDEYFNTFFCTYQFGSSCNKTGIVCSYDPPASGQFGL